jgi:hypothetical protein
MMNQISAAVLDHLVMKDLMAIAAVSAIKMD